MAQELMFHGEQVVEDRVHLIPKADVANGICKAKLVAVELGVSNTPIMNEKNEMSTYEYKGIDVPVLFFRFNGIPNSATELPSFFNHSEKVIISTKNDGTPMLDKDLTSLYNSMGTRLNHLFYAFSKSPTFSKTVWDAEVTPAATALFSNVRADVATRVGLYTTLFTAVVKAFNEGLNGKAIYVDVPIWLKLISMGNHYELPAFTGVNLDDGFIQMMVGNQPPVIRIKPNESIILTPKKQVSGKPSVDSPTEPIQEVSQEVMDMINGKK